MNDTLDRSELNLIGKLPKDYTLDEIIEMKKYAGYGFNHVLDTFDKKILIIQ